MTPRTRCMLLSFVVPGWGQFEQGRHIVGRRFLWASLAALLLWPLFAIARLPIALPLLEIAMLTLWAAADAWRAGTSASRT
ncbi:MAG: hypothetical protein IT359_10885 [Gemmatimonadaceae bacterium]|nr:hypothetical protein [Gemmatimonadaceae bacterium]